jgi:hypothetical protein
MQKDKSRTPEAKRQAITRRNERNDKRIRATMTLEKIAEHKAFYGSN